MVSDRKMLKEFDKFLEFFSEKKKKDSRVAGFHQMFVKHKNDIHIERFKQTPFEQRIILVPQCLRRIGACKAVENGFFYDCAHCGACAVDAITRKAEELAYKGAYVLKGGRAVKEIVEKQQPEAILGVACWYEGFLGIIECESHDIAVTFYPLLKDGCANTDLDTDGLLEFMSVIESADTA